jgi:hypothetical protein
MSIAEGILASRQCRALAEAQGARLWHRVQSAISPEAVRDEALVRAIAKWLLRRRQKTKS